MTHNEIEIIRSKRKTVSLEITPDCRIILRIPLHMTNAQAYRFADEKSQWIENKLELQRKRHSCADMGDRLSNEEIMKLTEKALAVITQRVRFYAPIIGVEYGKITIRKQRTLWGSCSAKNNLSFNCLLALASPEALDYVVVHELCHCKIKNHSKDFWAEVEKILPDYKNRRLWLKNNAARLMNYIEK